MDEPLTDRQRAIVELIEDGLISYGEIAEQLDVGASTVRSEVRLLCARHGCPMRDLPRLLERAA